MYYERRVTEQRAPIQIHHLPRQDPLVVAAAIDLLSEFELDCGVADALRNLCYSHPFAQGDFPEKPGYTLAEASAAGFVRATRGEDGMSLEMCALKWISECWVTNRHWVERYASTRISEYKRKLEESGYDISVEYRTSDTDSKQTYAFYRYFVDPVERAAWNAEQQIKLELSNAEEAERLADKAQAKADTLERQIAAAAAKDAERVARRAAAAEAKESKVAKREAAKADTVERRIAAAAAKEAERVARSAAAAEAKESKVAERKAAKAPETPQTSNRIPTGINAIAPVAAPPAPISLASAPGEDSDRGRDFRREPAPFHSPVAPSPAPVMATPRAPKREIVSALGVPAGDLNRLFPWAGSRAVVEHHGMQYIRRFRPVKHNGAVQAWETFWEKEYATSGAVGIQRPPRPQISAQDVPY